MTGMGPGGHDWGGGTSQGANAGPVPGRRGCTVLVVRNHLNMSR